MVQGKLLLFYTMPAGYITAKNIKNTSGIHGTDEAFVLLYHANPYSAVKITQNHMV